MKSFSPTVWIVLLLGCALSLAALHLAREDEDAHIRVAFEHLAESRFVNLEMEIQRDLQILRATGALFRASREVTRAEFNAFAAATLDPNRAIRAIQFAPHVLAADRARLEQAARADGLSGFTFTERAADGALLPAQPRADYFPVYYLEPLTGNEAALGMDLASLPEQLGAMAAARDDGDIRATPPLRLVQEPARQKGFVTFLPLYRGAPTTPEQRRRDCYGFAATVYRIGDLLDMAIRNAPARHGDIVTEIYDVTDGQPDPLLEIAVDAAARLDSTLRHEQRLTFAGRTWNIVSYATRDYLEAERSWQPPAIFAGSLALSLLLVVYARREAGRKADIRHLVEVRSAALRRSEAQVRAIVNTALNGIIVLDARGVVQMFNPAAARMFGYSPEEIVGRSIATLIPGTSSSPHDGAVGQYLHRNVSRVIGSGREVTGQRKDGTPFPLYLALSDAHVEEQRFFVAIALDITEQKEAEKLKEEFISNVSHELRTPLTAVKGALGLLLGNVSGELRPDARTTLEIAARNVDRQLVIVNDLLDLQKLESGQMALHMQTALLFPVVEQAVQALQGYAQHHQVGLQIAEVLADARANIDPDRLAQVLTNLLANAVKFSPRDAAVEISMKRLTEDVRIAVTDHGPGVTPEFRARMFQRFAQADAADNRARGGTGLGLAISKMLAERMGGRIGYLDRPGGGSIFFVDLPEYRG